VRVGGAGYHSSAGATVSMLLAYTDETMDSRFESNPQEMCSTLSHVAHSDRRCLWPLA